MSSAIFYLHALSPLHMGTGASVGAIDLPHSREAATRLPNVPGSGIKGVWRDQFPRSTAETQRLFGSEWKEGTRDQSAGAQTLLPLASSEGKEGTRDQAALLFSDAWLLCMPVMSYVGDFAWVTSPMSLARFARERRHTNPGTHPPALPQPTAGQALVTGECTLRHNDYLYLHELKVKAKTCNNTQEWAALIAVEVFADDPNFQEAFKKRFVLVGEAELVHLSGVAAHVPMRNALDDNKMVKDGALWSEENMPAETLFWGTVAADTIQTKDNQTHRAIDSLNQFTALARKTRQLQFGGKASIGRGVCRFVMPASTPSNPAGAA